MNTHTEPTYENQLWHARKLLREKGPDALNNPHGMTGRMCRCGDCFCCAAAQVLRNTCECGHTRDEHDAKGPCNVRNTKSHCICYQFRGVK